MNTEQELKKVRETVRRLCSEESVKNYPGPIPVVSFDTNRINSKQRLVAMNRIEELGRDGWIELRKSQTMFEELPEGSGLMRSKAEETLVVGGETLQLHEHEQLEQLRKLLFGRTDDLPLKDERDVQHVFDHQKYSCFCEWNFLITKDKHIRSKKSELKELRTNVGSSDECIEWLNCILPKVKERVQRYYKDAGDRRFIE